MNVICIMLDTFRQDHVSFYHGGNRAFESVPACQTPVLDAFAQECIVFDNAYPEALPTIPARTQLFTGQRTLPYRPWQPLTQEDISIADILRSEGYVCGLITDCYHYRAPGMNFHRGFHAYRWLRGQEYDPWMSHPTRRNLDDYVNENYDAVWRGRVAQFLANTDNFTEDEDWFAAQVVDEAIDWLRRNRVHPRLFAWIDSFDPHEPWDPPSRFDTYTDPNYGGKRLILPMGGEARNWATAEEIRHIQGLYAGEAAFVDHCLGRLLQALKDLGYYDDSVIVLLADHGHPLGDHGKFLKGTDRLYNELLKVPFMVRLPGGQGARRSQSIVQFHDVLPTLLDLLGMAKNAASMHGKSFLPVLRGDQDTHRESIITGFHEGTERCLRDMTWSYIQRPTGESGELYNLQEDPHERNNLIEQYPDEARRLADAFGSYYHLQMGKGISETRVRGIQGKYELGSSGIA
ncbi:MAG TPA: sulfatase [Anaerolineales bacterium]|nr:sulfatase [Anaerolineales bacterium]